ncbi:MAG: UDP-N-acetylmuramate dehydrogenase [Candidatus Saganbacteria bacterium]|nr:UDP-N-acetylmuramate dehydrogenase [Candidatus Saganbacteria bacterium]
MKRHQNELLSKHTSFKIGGPARVLLIPETIDELREFLKNNKDPFFILGLGSNVLFSDKGFSGTVIKTSELNSVIIEKNMVYAQAGVALSELIKITSARGFSGLEVLAGVPGALGGAVKGNAGAYGSSIGKLVEFVNVFTSPAVGGASKGISKTLNKKELEFSYRGSNIKGVIYEVGLKLRRKSTALIKKDIKKYLRLRQEKHPLGIPSAGSIFINPPGTTAGKLIEAAGLKGFRIGGAEVSNKHANFIVNRGSARSSDVLRLIKKIQNKVKDQLSVTLKPEIIIIE